MPGTIGFGMIDPVINNRRNAWHQKRYNIRVPRRAITKKYLDAYYTKQGGTDTTPPPNWTEAPFPIAIMQPSITGFIYDPMHPINNTLNTGAGTVPVPGDPVGRIAGYNPDLIDNNLTQATAGNRPIKVIKGDKPCFSFDGIAQFISATFTLPDWLTLPRSTTQFAMLWRDAAVPATDVSPFALTRAEVSNSFQRLFATNEANGLHGNVRFGGTLFVSNLIGLGAFPLGQWVEVIVEMTITQMSVGGVGSQAGTLKYWINDLPVVTHNILPDRANTTGITVMTRASLGGHFNSVTPAAFWNGCVGRSGFISKALNDTERAQLRNWMRGVTYIAP